MITELFGMVISSRKGISPEIDILKGKFHKKPTLIFKIKKRWQQIGKKM